MLVVVKNNYILMMIFSCILNVYKAVVFSSEV